MVEDSPNIPTQDSHEAAGNLHFPSWQILWALVQILLASLIIPVYVLFIQLLWDEFPLTIIPMIWIMGIGFGLAVIYSIASNIVFLWRAWKRTPMSVKNKAPRYNFLLVGGIIQLIIGTILLAMVIVILSTYGGDLFGEAAYLPTGILGTIDFIGYSIVMYTSGLRNLISAHRHVPFARLGTGFVVVGIILLITMPVAGLSTLFVTCNSSLSFPAGIEMQINLFSQGDNGYNTYKIPSLIVAPNGTIFAFCEGRKDSNADHGNIQIVMRKSYDNGLMWTPMQILVNAGPITAGNPCPVVDHVTGVMWLLYCINNLQVFAINSTDNGETWSTATPLDITNAVTDPSWTWIGTGPGNGIQLASGRLYIPTYHIIGSDQYCGGIYSDDHGVTWHASQYVFGLFEEPQAVQLVNGTVLLDLRPDSGVNLRAFAWSNDNGTTWSAPVYQSALISPSCQGSIIRYTNTTSFSENRLICSNPADTRRDNLVIRVSYDEGQTWKYSQPLWSGEAGYSDLAISKDNQICSLFEYGCLNYYEHIAFAKYNMTWLTNGADTSL